MNKTSKFQKVLSVVLVMMMMLTCLTIVPMTASAAEAGASVWDGSTKTATDAYKGSGTAADPYQIANGADLAGLKALLSGKTDTYVVLTDNIDLDGKAFSQISYSGKLHLDGQNHTISGLTMSGTGFINTLTL